MTVSKGKATLTDFQKTCLNIVIVIGSCLICLLLSPMRFPGIELLGVSPNWLLIWVVIWSIHYPIFDGAIAGIVLGLLQDGLTGPFPTHALSLMVVGMLTARLQRQRIIQENVVLVAFIVFGMAVVGATMMALQMSFRHILWPNSPYLNLWQIWRTHQRVALSSAILSSLWTPALYYPLHHWWKGYLKAKN
ncbi:rod shape-determining protein MreD [Leptothoe spongobia]|uniref:Rod shape-determining protein MreD n=1 Tax=Leptothoe spongobia TAU-MAC 1115 TaxID=1967444 RepID=A0A947GIG4_9CYAN|nr:rod shape-determining protein MreD [Leptothoe spongobia]MBT9316165.1 rod shape-determining protein MreD [Leptothoe spongobia TAU-MAC 1115]